MKTITLTKGLVAKVDDEDFPLVSRYRWCVSGEACRPYAATSIGGKAVSLHRLIMGVVERRVQVDHINRDTLDCTRENMRLATIAQNRANSSCCSQSGFKGVFVRKTGRFMAQIVVSRKCIYLGTFDSREDAARVYDDAARRHFGVFARVNFPAVDERGCL